MVDDDLDSFDERAPLLSEVSETPGHDLESDALIPAEVVPSSGPLSTVDGNDTRKAEYRDPEKAFHETLLEADLENDAPISEEPDRPLKFSRRIYSWVISSLKLCSALEWIGVVIFVLSTIVILAASSTILSLWLKRSAWRRDIALGDKVTSLVTTQCKILGVAAAVQVAVLTSGLCVTKSSRSSSQYLVPPSGNTSPRILSYRVCVIAAITLLLSATTIASRFFAPLLLSDLDPTAVGRPAAPFPIHVLRMSYQYNPEEYQAYRLRYDNDPNRIPYGFGWFKREQLRWSEPDFSTLPATLFPTFAEYKNASARDTQPGVDDTGAVIRALFPINNTKSRENLWIYDGYATLVNSRVICVRPTVLDARISWDDGSNSTFVEGNLSFGATRPSGIHHDNGRDPRNETDFETPIPFRCYLVVPPRDGVDWPISLCAVGSPTGNPPSPGRFGLQVDSPFHGAGQPRPYVMLNYTGSAPISPFPESPFSTATPSSSPWTQLNWTGMEGFELHLSLCFPSFQAVDTKIFASSTTNRSEPVLSHDSVTFNSTALLNQLDANRRTSCFNRGRGLWHRSDNSISDRGIMKLNPQLPWARFGEYTFNLDFTFGFSNRAFGQHNPWNESINYYPHTYGLCAGCGRDVGLEEVVRGGGGGNVRGNRIATDDRRVVGGVGVAKQVDKVLARIFMDALRVEGVGPARALQALFWVLNAGQYYRRVPHFEVRGYSSLSFFEEHVFPVGRHGLRVVSAILGVHLLIVGLAVAVLVLWRRCDKRSGVGLGPRTGGGKEEGYCDVREETFKEEEEVAREQGTAS